MPNNNEKHQYVKILLLSLFTSHPNPPCQVLNNKFPPHRFSIQTKVINFAESFFIIRYI